MSRCAALRLTTAMCCHSTGWSSPPGRQRASFLLSKAWKVFSRSATRTTRVSFAQPRRRRSALIIGGGYIGLEIAATLTKAGKKVTIIEAAARVLARVASPPVSAFFEARHGDAGVDVITGKSLAEIRSQNGKFVGATLKGGRQIDADILVVGIGVTPNTHLAQQAGLVTANGIVTDTRMQTSQSDIYAIGDCACDGSAGPGLRIESVHNARQHAERAAAAVMGSDLPRRQTHWFWSDQYDVKLQSVGVLPSDGRVLTIFSVKGVAQGASLSGV